MVAVLGRGWVKVVDWMGSDARVEYAARQSTLGDMEQEGERTKEQREKLVSYLGKERHTSPFEHCVMSVEVKAPIFVAREWMRHRTQSYSEMSLRYVEVEVRGKEVEDLMYVPPVGLVGVEKGRQGRKAESDVERDKMLLAEYREAGLRSFEAYGWMVKEGMPREVARGVLPVATWTRFMATANLKNWCDWVQLRVAEGAQWEIREYARVVYAGLVERWPVATRALLVIPERS